MARTGTIFVALTLDGAPLVAALVAHRRQFNREVVRARQAIRWNALEMWMSRKSLPLRPQLVGAPDRCRAAFPSDWRLLCARPGGHGLRHYACEGRRIIAVWGDQE